jgi:hypothetical protein
LAAPLWALAAMVALLPVTAVSQDADTKEVQRYVLTDAALAKYKQAATRLAALPGDTAGDCSDDDGDASIAASVAKLDATPAAKSAIQGAGLTTREYVVFTWSLLHNGLAAWAVSQPGGKLPAGTSQANVDFYKRHAAEIESLPKGPEAECGDEQAEEEPEE